MNRIVRWLDSGIAYEVDPRQAEKLVDELGLNTTRNDGGEVVGHPLHEANGGAGKVRQITT